MVATTIIWGTLCLLSYHTNFDEPFYTLSFYCKGDATACSSFQKWDDVTCTKDKTQWYCATDRLGCSGTSYRNDFNVSLPAGKQIATVKNTIVSQGKPPYVYQGRAPVSFTNQLTLPRVKGHTASVPRRSTPNDGLSLSKERLQKRGLSPQGLEKLAQVAYKQFKQTFLNAKPLSEEAAMQGFLNGFADWTQSMGMGTKPSFVSDMTNILASAAGANMLPVVKDLSQCKFEQALKDGTKAMIDTAITEASAVLVFETAGASLAFGLILHIGVSIFVDLAFASHDALLPLTVPTPAHTIYLDVDSAICEDVSRKGLSTCCPSDCGCIKGNCSEYASTCGDLPNFGMDTCSQKQILTWQKQFMNSIDSGEPCGLSGLNYTTNQYNFKCCECPAAYIPVQPSYCSNYPNDACVGGCPSIYQQPMIGSDGGWQCRNSLCPPL